MWLDRQADMTKLIGNFCYCNCTWKGERCWNVYTMRKFVWSNEEPSGHHFKNRRKLAALKISAAVL
jgi:hypothetical protein